MSRMNEILKFWFADVAENADTIPGRQKLWWSKDLEMDGYINNTFGEDVKKAAQSDYDSWEATPENMLAMIVLLDQFSRNIYRDTEQAFANDAKALRLALVGIETEQDEKLSYFERVFFYLPLEHAEDKALQKKCVELFKKLSKEVPKNLKKEFDYFLKYAEDHKTVIDRFGRFPHRNKILNRESTPEELEFLKEPGSSF